MDCSMAELGSGEGWHSADALGHCRSPTLSAFAFAQRPRRDWLMTEMQYAEVSAGTVDGMFDGMFDETFDGMSNGTFVGMFDGMFDGMLDGVGACRKPLSAVDSAP